MMSEKARIAEAIRDAGYVKSTRLAGETEQWLRSLPKRRIRTARDQVLTVLATAAVLTVFLAFGMPKVVEAARALVNRLFSERAQRMEQQVAMPEDERLAQSVMDYERFSRGHALYESVEFEGAAVQLNYIRFMPEEAFNADNPRGSCDIGLKFPEIPSFDPSWMEFELVYGGVAHPMKIGDALAAYRRSNFRNTTRAEWEVSVENWDAGDAYFDDQDGALIYPIDWDLDQWKIDEKTDMVLRGSLDGRVLEIPFTYDPALAHAEAVEWAKSGLELDQAWNRRDLSQLEGAASNAGRVGYVGQARAIGYEVTELSLVGDRLFVSAAYSGIKDTNPKLAAMTYWMETVYVDGYSLHHDSGWEGEIENGVYSEIFDAYLAWEQLPLKDESLIAVQFRLGNADGKDSHEFGEDYEYNIGYAVFRYNWQTRTATLPKDETEDAAWLAEANELRDRVQAEQPEKLWYRLRKDGERQSHGSMGFDAIMLSVQGAKLEVNYTLYTDVVNWPDGRSVELQDGDGILPVLMIDGVTAPYARTRLVSGDPSISEFDLPDGIALGEGSKIALSLPARTVKDGVVLEEHVFTFEAVLGAPQDGPFL